MSRRPLGHRSPTSATDVKVEHTRERPEPRKRGGRRSTGYPAGSKLPLHRSLRPDQASARTRERPAQSRNGHPCRTAVEREARSGSRTAPCPEARLRPAARTAKPSKRTWVPSRRPEPRLFTAAPRRVPSEPARASIFHAHDGVALDGAHRRTRGREASSVAQHATEPTCLRRPNDVLRNVSPASRCAASFEFTLARRNVTSKPKTRSKRNFFVHKMHATKVFDRPHVVCNLRVLRTRTHQLLPSVRAAFPPEDRVILAGCGLLAGFFLSCGLARPGKHRSSQFIEPCLSNSIS